MRVWDEGSLIKQLAVSQKASSAEKEEATTRNSKSDGDPVAFLLVLVRKFAEKHYEFLFIPASCYDKLEQVYNTTSVETLNSDYVKNDEDEDMEYGVWIGRSAEHDEKLTNKNGSFKISAGYESHYVGKAIFHTASGEPFLKMEGSTGWKEAMKQKYLNVESLSRRLGDKMNLDDKNTTAKAVAAAAIGGGAAAGGSSIMAANAAAAAATTASAGTLSFEAFGAGSFAASGGFGAAAQTAGTVGVMASPVGVVAAAGALGGLGLYYVMHRRNQAKKEKNLDEESLSTMLTEDESGSEGDSPSGYQQLGDEHEAEVEEERISHLKRWVCLIVKKADCEESHGPYVFVPTVRSSQEDAERDLEELSTNMIAKALFCPEGKILLVDAEAGDVDGWGTALVLHHEFLMDSSLIAATQEAEATAEDTPLLEIEKMPPKQEKKVNNWVFESLRKRRQQIGQLPGPGAILSGPFR